MLRGKMFSSTAVVRRSAVPASAASLFRFSSMSSASTSCSSNNVTMMSAATVVSAVPVVSAAVRFGPTTGRPEPEMKRAGAYLLDRSDVLARVTEVLKNFEKVDASKVTAESHFINDLGLDSLDVVEVVMALEQEFVLDIPDHEAEKIQSIPDAVEYLASNPMAK